MVYTVSKQQISGTSLQESFCEFKLQSIQHEQEIFESMIGMEYDSILNESGLEVIHEGKIMDIVNKIIELIKKFVGFIKQQWTKFKTFVTQKILKWKQKVEEEEAKAEEHAETGQKKYIDGHEVKSMSRGKELKVTEVECIILNRKGTSTISNMFSTIHNFISDYGELVDDTIDLFLDSNNNIQIDNTDEKIFQSIQRKFGGGSDINTPVRRRILSKMNIEGENASVKDVIKSNMIMKKVIKSNDKSSINDIKNNIDYASSQLVKEYDKIYDNTIKYCNDMEKNTKELLKLNNISYSNKNSNDITPLVTKSLSTLSKIASSVTSVASEFYNAIIQELIYGIDQANISYIKLLKANPVVVNW